MDDLDSIPASENTSLHIPKPMYAKQENSHSEECTYAGGTEHLIELPG
jgi:hypothetical protein